MLTFVGGPMVRKVYESPSGTCLFFVNVKIDPSIFPWYRRYNFPVSKINWEDLKIALHTRFQGFGPRSQTFEGIQKALWGGVVDEALRKGRLLSGNAFSVTPSHILGELLDNP